jgi:CheY-like chemotaxis protein
MKKIKKKTAEPSTPAPRETSELNNLLQIISGTTDLIENIWSGRAGSEKYFAMLRASIERAEHITAQLVRQAGGANETVLMYPELAGMARPKTPARPRKKRLLIVDDEEMALSVMKTILEDAGFEVNTARSGFECLDLLTTRKRRFDLILLDLSMPFMDGEETFGRIRSISSEALVVLLTGFVEHPRLDRMLDAGLAGMLCKPQAGADLVAYVRSMLDGDSEEDQTNWDIPPALKKPA